MALLHYKTNDLFTRGKPLSEARAANSALNIEEGARGEPFPRSVPRRLVLELTNDCNLSCRMCGRQEAVFSKTYFKMEWLGLLEPIFPFIEEVTLMGWGEPTLHPDFRRILQFIHERGPRIYLCTNGMNLGFLREDIFSNEVDIIAVSLDGSTAGQNSAIRRGADFERIVNGVVGIVAERKKRGITHPYINFITTLMADNLTDFPAIVELAGVLGIEEAKAVYLTVFSERLSEQSLFDRQAEVEDCFSKALAAGVRLNIDIKLPSIQGKDPAKNASHQLCLSPWRDFFIGSDGFVRPCMSTARKFFPVSEFSEFSSMWRHPRLADFRRNVNNEEIMDSGCRLCYQSSHANWNRREAFTRIDGSFAPSWQGDAEVRE